MLVPHQGPEFRSHFLRRSNNVALIVYHSCKTINCLLTARSLAAVSFAWLMPTQHHRPHTALLNIVAKRALRSQATAGSASINSYAPCPPLAPNRHAKAVQRCLFIGVDRKSLAHEQSDANDLSGLTQNSGLPRSNFRLQHPGLQCRDVVCFDLDLAWS